MQEIQVSEVASQFVDGLDYPASKDTIVTSAREANLGPTLLEALKKVPDREYVDAQDLTQQLNAVA